MDVREAEDADAAALEALVDADLDADRLVRERTVLVAEEGDEIRGFLSYDTWSGTVHVSTMVGEPPVVDELLGEPRRFADAQDIPVEIVVPVHDDELQSIVTGAGFERVGTGPLFDGDPSHRYRYNED
ncbi:hypothetical protein [Halanaeroarchaeum sulfurireducens]|uniref:N-acetyltransferase domain-containing protein n=1 Tax=Halanaeroarchaeum sulfurireducens TaxID=1604004 RepID=A0A0F7P5Q8_9EURY|nr:hypothetical protein [Halanaeroarchaeum sulfurireducens]AKH96521.1 hypothetical protein HLASF_0006 [Halanaeroarchaeum sulfurireducens]